MPKGIMDSFSMLNEDLVNLALDISTPSIERLIETQSPQVVWGPKRIIIAVHHPVLKIPIKRWIGEILVWHGDWGAIEDFEEIAHWKAKTAQREGKPTSQLTLEYPHDHMPGDFLYPGGVVSGKLGVGGSGLKGFGDEIASNIVTSTIIGLCKLKREQLYANSIHQLIRS